MRSLHRLARHSVFQFTVALIAAGSWLSGCGDDEEGDNGGDNGTGGSGVTGGNAGATTGGSAGNGGSTTGGSAGNPTGGSAGAPMGGSAGAPMGGSAGSSAGAGMGGEATGGEGGIGDGGMAGTSGMGGMGEGGEGGSSDAMCATNDLSFTELDSMQAHDHLPIAGMARMTLLNMINTGMPLVFTLPEEGSNPHQHTLTFTAQQLTTLRNGGSIAMITTSTNGPTGNMHTHTYSITCAP